MISSTHSSWELVPPLPRYKNARGSLKADIAIIGGGIAGVLQAYMLARAGKGVIIFEAERVASGATRYTSGFLTQVIDTDAVDMIAIYGLRRARQIWSSHGRAIDLIERIIDEESINCEFKRCSNFIYANKLSEITRLKKEAAALKQLGARVNFKQGCDLGFNASAYLEISGQAKIHPLKLIKSLLVAIEKCGGKIFENSPVEKISGRRQLIIAGKNFKARAHTVITSTYQPFDNPWEVFLKKGMYKSYILEASLPTGRVREGIYEDMDNPYHYFRLDKGRKRDRLIIGGADHRNELKFSEKKAFASLRGYLDRLIGSDTYRLRRRWAGPVLEPSDGLALIGEYEPNKLVATAFSGNGLTYAALSALICRDIIRAKPNSWIRLYDPKRIPTLKQLARKGFDYGQELAEGAVRIMIS